MASLSCMAVPRFFLLLLLSALARAAFEPVYLPHQLRAIANPPPIKSQNVTASELAHAQKLVDSAIKQQSEYNKFRVANPRLNNYKVRPTTQQNQTRPGEPTPPALTKELQAAAVLLAEYNARQQSANGTLHKSYDEFKNLPHQSDSNIVKRGASSSYWASQVDHGNAPMGSNSSYPVFRDVTAYGATGNGVTDDTNAINAAIAAGGNCGANCLSSSVKGTFIYFPPGTYLISSPINAYYYSQLVGDPNNIPVIKTSQSFVGLGAIQSDVYYPNGNGGEWYVVQSNFFRQVRNLLIDITQTTTANTAGLHWQVGQATSVNYVYITASQNSGTTQMGIFTENGSGGFMSDCTIIGGAFGIWGGNQQYTVRNFEISQQANASIQLIWDWGWTWSGLHLSSAPVGILLTPQQGDSQDPGSTYILDTEFNDVGTAILADFEKFTILDTSIITLDNVYATAAQHMVAYSNGNYQDIPVGYIDFAIVGNVQQFGQNFGAYNYTRPDPPPALLGNSSSTGGRPPYFTKSRPQYSSYAASAMVSVKSYGATGNGVTDDTNAIQSALNALAGTIGSQVLYFPPGSYIVSSTLFVPPSVAITGQVWSQLVASGSYFANEASPKPMLQVGKPGSTGAVEISDMLFTSIGSLPGLIAVEWNVQGSSQGAVGMWDCHFRIGGAYGTELQVANCPSSKPLQSNCVAATMMLHITPQSNGYFENVWAWVADHDIDDSQNSQISVAVARGILIEAQSSVWMYGTASEHSMLYQYAFVNSTDTFAGMMQTESPYFQGVSSSTSQSPGPFNQSMGLFSGDPSFPDPSCNASAALCDVGWALIMNSTTNLTIAGAGFYSWFDNYVESCVGTQNCQQRLVSDAGNNVYLALYNLITIGSVEMVSSLDEVILAKNNTQSLGHPYWSALAAYLDSDMPMELSCPYNFTTADGGTCTDYFEDPCDPYYNTTFSDFTSMQAAAGGIPQDCYNDIALGTLANVASNALDNYTNIDYGYDDVYGYYQSAQQDQVIQLITDSMLDSQGENDPGGWGNQYFECSVNDQPNRACPPGEWSNPGSGFSVTYTPTNLSGYYDVLNQTYGISSSWVTTLTTTIPAAPARTCAPDKVSGCEPQGKVVIRGQPVPVAKADIDIINPKTVIEAALPLMQNISTTLTARYIGRVWDTYVGSRYELLQAFSLPVLRFQVGLNFMASAKNYAENAAEAAEAQIIEAVLGAVIAVLPFAALVPELAPLEGLLTTVSDVGNIGLTAQQIQEDPKSAPYAILGLLGVGRGGEESTEEDIAQVAALRRDDSIDEETIVGQEYKKLDDVFEGLMKRTCFG